MCRQHLHPDLIPRAPQTLVVTCTTDRLRMSGMTSQKNPVVDDFNEIRSASITILMGFQGGMLVGLASGLQTNQAVRPTGVVCMVKEGGN